MHRLFAGLLFFVCMTAAASELQVKSSVYVSSMETGGRKRVFKHPRIYARFQPYNLYGNYLEDWIDRPLYHSSNYRDHDPAVAFQRDVQTTKEYGIAGLTILGNAYATRYRDALRMLEKAPVPGIEFMAGMSWGYNPERQLNNAKWAENSPLTVRHNGRIIFFPYLSPQGDVADKMRKLLKDNGLGEPIYFAGLWTDLFAEYNNNKRQVSEKTLKKIASEIKARLDKFEGLVITDYHMHRDPQGDYPIIRKFYPDINRRYLSPLVADVFSQYDGKFLGYDIRHGYINHESGTNEAELGTSQFRVAMDGALLLNPDIFSLVEWNEVNENTCFLPTVLNSRTFQRLIRYYADFLNGKKPSPNPGDDLSIPNLAVSVRRTVAIGERYRMEVLHIPDGSADEVKFKLHLYDENGKLLWSSAEHKFDPAKLADVTFTADTSQISRVRSVNPVLEVNYKGKIRNFNCRHTRLELTHNWDMKEILMPLRDMMFADKAEFSVVRRDGADYATVRIKNPTPLKAVEILDRDREVYTHGESIDRKKYTVVTMRFNGMKSGNVPCRITVEGTEDFQFRPWGRPYAGFGKLQKMGNRLYGSLLSWHRGSVLLLFLPAEAVAVNAEFGETYGSHRIDLTELKAKGEYAAALKNHQYLHWRICDTPFEHPHDLNAKDIEFTVKLPPRRNGETGIYHLRVIDMEHRIFRSKPVFAGLPDKPQSIMHNVFSSTERKALTVPVWRDLVDVLDFKFTPEYGDLLTVPGKSAWTATLGNGITYSMPLWRTPVPAGASKATPEWVKDADGRWMLKFDGKYNSINFNIDTLPNGVFTLEFDIKPDKVDNVMLFSQTFHRGASLQLWVSNGKLQSAFIHMGRSLSDETKLIPLNLTVEAGKWQKIKVTFDYKQLVYSVNGKSETVPFTLRPAKALAGIFGMCRPGDVLLDKKLHLKPFEGLLRKFTVIRGMDKK